MAVATGQISYLNYIMVNARFVSVRGLIRVMLRVLTWDNELFLMRQKKKKLSTLVRIMLVGTYLELQSLCGFNICKVTLTDEKHVFHTKLRE